MRRIARIYELGTLDRSPLEMVHKSVYELKESVYELKEADEAIISHLVGEVEKVEEISENVAIIDSRLEELRLGVITLQGLNDLEEQVQQFERLPIVAMKRLELQLQEFTQKMIRFNTLHKEAVQNAVDAVQSSRLKLLENPPQEHNGILGAVLFEVIIAVLPYSLIVKAAMLPLRGLLNFIAKALVKRRYGSTRNFLLAFDQPRLNVHNKIIAERKLVQESRQARNALVKDRENQIASLEAKGQDKFRRATKSKEKRKKSKQIKHDIDRRIDRQIKKVDEDIKNRINERKSNEEKYRETIKAIQGTLKQVSRPSEKDIDIAKELTKLLKPKGVEQNQLRTGGFLVEDVAKAKVDLKKNILPKSFEKGLGNIRKNMSNETSNPPPIATGKCEEVNIVEESTGINSGTSDESAISTPMDGQCEVQSNTSSTFYDSTKLPLDIAFKIYVQNLYDEEISTLIGLTELISNLRLLAEEGPSAAWRAFDELKMALDGKENKQKGVLNAFAVFISEEVGSARHFTYADLLQLRHELTAQYEFIIWSILLVDEFELRAYEPAQVISKAVFGPGDMVGDSMELFKIQTYKEIPLEDVLEAGQQSTESFIIAVPKAQSKSEVITEMKPRSTLLNIPTYRYLFDRFGNNEFNPTIEDLAKNMKACANKYGQLINEA